MHWEWRKRKDDLLTWVYLDLLISAGACVISLDFNVNLWHQSFSSLENLAEQEKLWCQFFCQGLVCQNRLNRTFIIPYYRPAIERVCRDT